MFLDRDGTLIHDPGYLGSAQDVRLLPGVADALRALVRAGFELVVVTNQSGIARGRYSISDYEQVAARLGALLKAEGITLRRTYYCPFHPDGTVAPFNVEHEDRKPECGMWRRAEQDLGIDLATSWSIGDGERDVVAGRRAGTRAILLAAERDKWPLPVQGPYDAEFVALDLREAVLYLLREEGHPLPARPGAPLAP